jgi:hypothetical protein
MILPKTGRIAIPGTFPSLFCVGERIDLQVARNYAQGTFGFPGAHLASGGVSPPKVL